MLPLLNASALECCTHILFIGGEIDARGREPTMPQHALDFRQLCPTREHPSCQAVAQHMGGDRFQPSRQILEILAACDIPLQLRLSTQLLGRTLPAPTPALAAAQSGTRNTVVDGRTARCWASSCYPA